MALNTMCWCWWFPNVQIQPGSLLHSKLLHSPIWHLHLDASWISQLHMFKLEHQILNHYLHSLSHFREGQLCSFKSCFNKDWIYNLFLLLNDQTINTSFWFPILHMSRIWLLLTISTVTTLIPASMLSCLCQESNQNELWSSSDVRIRDIWIYCVLMKDVGLVWWCALLLKHFNGFLLVAEENPQLFHCPPRPQRIWPHAATRTYLLLLSLLVLCVSVAVPSLLFLYHTKHAPVLGLYTCFSWSLEHFSFRYA